MERPREIIGYPAQFGPHLLDIIITWSAIDGDMERYRALLAQQPGMKTRHAKVTPFRRRLSNFEALCTEYFSSAPAFRKFLAQQINGIRRAEEDRNLVAHGNHGARGDGKAIYLVLYMFDRGGVHVQKEYSLEEFRKKADEIGWYLFVMSLFRSFNNDAILTDHCGVPQKQVETVKKLLDPIHNPPKSPAPKQPPQSPLARLLAWLRQRWSRIWDR
jgi:hypothetical protein